MSLPINNYFKCTWIKFLQSKETKQLEFTANKIQQCCLSMIHISFNHTKVEMKAWKELPYKFTERETKLSIFTSNKMHIYSVKISKKRKRRLLNSVKVRLVYQEHITMLNIFESNI